MICVKLHKSYRNVLAVCDANILGKTFEEGVKQIHLRESFYNEKEISYEEAVKLMKQQAREDATFNIAGESSVKAAMEAGLVDSKHVMKVQNIPHILILL